ncbi:hypothetical protein M758_1G093400 [Ceratodon purpureus]|nr:hypothetical protein M758_1G093400 [Ceratodon purpureus]
MRFGRSRGCFRARICLSSVRAVYFLLDQFLSVSSDGLSSLYNVQYESSVGHRFGVSCYA